MLVKCLHCSQVQQVTDDYRIPTLGQNFTCKRCGKQSAAMVECEEMPPPEELPAADKPKQNWRGPIIVMVIFILAVIFIATCLV